MPPTSRGRLPAHRLFPAAGNAGATSAVGSTGAGHPTGADGRAGVPVRGGERGSATVEAAIAVCAVVAVLAMALGGAATVLAQLRCTDAAREAARLVARGEQDRAAEVAGRIAPGGAAVDIRLGGDEVVVVVTAEPVGGLGLLSVRAEAMAVLEPGVAGTG